MKNRIILMFLFLVNFSVNALDFKNVPLIDLVDFISKNTNKVIYVDKDINATVSLFVPEYISEKDLFSLFSSTVSNKGYYLYKKNNVYRLLNKRSEKLNTYIYKLKNNSAKSIQSLFNNFGVKYIYLPDDNVYIYKATKKVHEDLSKKFLIFDKSAKQVLMKIYILEFKDSDIKDRGLQFATMYERFGVVESVLNAIVFPLKTTSNILNRTDYFLALKFLNEQKLVNIKQYPFLLVKNNKKFVFEAVENIPYMSKTTTTDSNTVQEQTSVDYRDVGLKIYGTASMFKDYLSLNLDLFIEDLVDSSLNDYTPVTFKRHLNSNTNLEYDRILIISGLKRKKKIVNDWSIPFLSNIPYLGKVFQYKHNSFETQNITIAIEIISNDLAVHASDLVSEGRTNKAERSDGSCQFNKSLPTFKEKEIQGDDFEKIWSVK